jgi:ABC-type Fe3+-hydroxamate transport system substrate-binding protein
MKLTKEQIEDLRWCHEAGKRSAAETELTAARAGAREEAAKVADYFADKWKRLRDEQADVADKVIYNERWDASATIAESIRRLAARKAGSEG